EARHQVLEEPRARGEGGFAHLTNLTVGAELRGEPGDAVRAVDSDPRQRQQAVAGRGRPGALDRRSEEAGRTNGGEHTCVVAARGIAEEGDRNMEEAPEQH